jgi:hypothetical protein
MQCRRYELLRDELRFLEWLLLREELLLRFGTLAPFFRASESPIAIACLRLFTFPPWPLLPRFNVPCLRRRIALSTLFCARRPYFRPPLDFRRLRFAAMKPPSAYCHQLMRNKAAIEVLRHAQTEGVQA